MRRHLEQLREQFRDAAAARAAAEARLAAATRAASELNCTVVGDPALTAERPLRLEGVHAALASTAWTIIEAVHTLDARGFLMSLRARPTPDASSSES